MEFDSSFDPGIRRADEFVREGNHGPVAVAIRSRSFRLLKDADAMPFGAFRGKPIGKVPAEYLDRLRDANWLDDRFPAVAEYIERNAAAIDKDLETSDRSRAR
jgi:hypothetical protein